MAHNFLVERDLKIYPTTRFNKHAAFLKSSRLKLYLFKQIPTAMGHVLKLFCPYISISVCTEELKNH
jgi:hypothetical protein